MSDAEPYLETHIDPDHGLWIPPALRQFDQQVVIRTPQGTIQHFQSGGGELGPYYGIVESKHFGPPDSFKSPKNAHLAPDRVSIKPQGEDTVTLHVTDGLHDGDSSA